jgi:hypothetical protein
MSRRFLVWAGALVACCCAAPCARATAVEVGLAQAGVRLAMILNEAAKTNP